MFRFFRNCRWLAASVCAVALSCSGCVWSWQKFHDQIMGPGFDDEFSKSGQKLRSDKGEPVEHDGLSKKAQQIEDDLR
jgi:hypothetical protein